MVVIGVIIILMVISSALVTVACMLSSQCSRVEEQRARITFKLAGHLSDSPAAQQRGLEGSNLVL